MSLFTKNKRRKARRKERTSHKVRLHSSRPRIAVFRSLNQLYGQIINDTAHQTLIAASTLELNDFAGSKSDQAREIGRQLAKKAIDKGIAEAVLDRGAYVYHGRVKAFVEGLREGGLQV